MLKLSGFEKQFQNLFRARFFLSPPSCSRIVLFMAPPCPHLLLLLSLALAMPVATSLGRADRSAHTTASVLSSSSASTHRALETAALIPSSDAEKPTLPKQEALGKAGSEEGATAPPKAGADGCSPPEAKADGTLGACPARCPHARAKTPAVQAGCGDLGTGYESLQKQTIFKAACNYHNSCYALCRPGMNRKTCDEQFGALLEKLCNLYHAPGDAGHKACATVAMQLYEVARQASGQKSFALGVANFCQCSKAEPTDAVEKWNANLQKDMAMKPDLYEPIKELIAKFTKAVESTPLPKPEGKVAEGKVAVGKESDKAAKPEGKVAEGKESDKAAKPEGKLMLR